MVTSFIPHSRQAPTLFLVASADAAVDSLTGFITDSLTHFPIAGATVKLASATAASTTNALGAYKINTGVGVIMQRADHQTMSAPYFRNNTLYFGVANNGQRVTIGLYSFVGRCVVTLMDGQLGQGNYNVNVQKSGLGSGLYLVKLQAGSAAPIVLELPCLNDRFASSATRSTSVVRGLSKTKAAVDTIVVTAPGHWGNRLAVSSLSGANTIELPGKIKISPRAASVKLDSTKQFSATAFGQSGTALGTQPTFSWSVTGGGTMSSTGLFQASATDTGTFLAIAASGSDTAKAIVKVINRKLGINLFAPMGGECYKFGDTLFTRWRIQHDSVQQVIVAITLNNGQSYTYIQPGASGMQTGHGADTLMAWVIPDSLYNDFQGAMVPTQVGTQCRIQISNYQGQYIHETKNFTVTKK